MQTPSVPIMPPSVYHQPLDNNQSTQQISPNIWSAMSLSEQTTQPHALPLPMLTLDGMAEGLSSTHCRPTKPIGKTCHRLSVGADPIFPYQYHESVESELYSSSKTPYRPLR